MDLSTPFHDTSLSEEVSYFKGTWGGQNVYAPGVKNIWLDKQGVRLVVPIMFSKEKDLFNWDSIQRVDTNRQIEEEKVSVGKAIGGGLLFGPVGAVLGGMSGGKKVTHSLHITYLTSANIKNELILSGSPTLIERLKKKIDNELIKRFGTAERMAIEAVDDTPKSSNADRIEALSKLAELKKSGVLTDAEFEEQKKKLLS